MSFWELALIAIIALIVLGPERLPKAARTVGLWIGKAKQSFESIKTEIDRELKVKELQEQILAQKQAIESDSGLSSLKDELQDSANSIADQSQQFKESLSGVNFNNDSETTSAKADDQTVNIPESSELTQSNKKPEQKSVSSNTK